MRYSLQTEPSGIDYTRFVEFAVEECEFVCLRVRSDQEVAPSVAVILKALGAQIENVAALTEPGTQTYVARLSESVIPIVTLPGGLYNWQRPDRPEDISFLRKDKSLWMTTISHHQEGYFELSQKEFEKFDHRFSGWLLPNPKLERGDRSSSVFVEAAIEELRRLNKRLILGNVNIKKFSSDEWMIANSLERLKALPPDYCRLLESLDLILCRISEVYITASFESARLTSILDSMNRLLGSNR